MNTESTKGKGETRACEYCDHYGETHVVCATQCDMCKAESNILPTSESTTMLAEWAIAKAARGGKTLEQARGEARFNGIGNPRG